MKPFQTNRIDLLHPRFLGSGWIVVTLLQGRPEGNDHMVGSKSGWQGQLNTWRKNWLRHTTTKLASSATGAVKSEMR
jgi:hypothetical protein